MPDKQTYLLFFIGISFTLSMMEVFVYFWLKTLLRHDFPVRSKQWMPRIRWVFILANIPFVFQFFRRQIPYDLPTLTQIMFYPFTIWQFTIMTWTVILLPVSLYFVVKKLVRNSIRRFHVQ